MRNSSRLFFRWLATSSAKRSLHVNRIQPTPEFAANRTHPAYMLKAKAGMQRDRSRLTSADNSQHLPKAGCLGCINQRDQQKLADTFADIIGMDVDRIFAGQAISRAIPKLRRISIAEDDLAIGADKERPTALCAFSYFGNGRLYRARFGIETSSTIMHMMGINLGNLGRIL